MRKTSKYLSPRENLISIAENRLIPSLTDPNYLVLRSRRRRFAEWINRLPERDLNVLDIGGRYQPYRPLFKNRIGCYIGLDILQTELVDVVANGETLPFAENSFDVVIATQVFEYFPRPHIAIAEILAALKPKGCLFASVAAFAPRFVDEELWRFTPAGLRSLLSGYQEVIVSPETSSGGGVLRALNLALSSLPRYRFLNALSKRTIVPALNLLGVAVENTKITANDQFAPNYSILAIK